MVNFIKKYKLLYFILCIFTLLLSACDNVSQARQDALIIQEFDKKFGQKFQANAREIRLKIDALVKDGAGREVTKQDIELSSQYMNEMKGNLDKVIFELNNLKLKHPLTIELRENLNEIYHLMYKMLEIVNHAIYLRYQGIELSKERKKEMDNEMASIKQQIQNKMSAVKYSAEELAKEANKK
ncbi:hypothetical protein [Mannheimia indoligenes]|uniref:hypothetical protein n=1 Tax=Mannheimia indoligenes TaxID=3103145 RepID=UPI002FE539A0